MHNNFVHLMTIPQYDTVSQYDVEDDNYNAKLRLIVSSVIPTKKRDKISSPDQTQPPRSSPQGQPHLPNSQGRLRQDTQLTQA